MGHLISADGIRPNPEKIRAVVDFPVPTDVKKVWSFWEWLVIIEDLFLISPRLQIRYTLTRQDVPF